MSTGLQRIFVQYQNSTPKEWAYLMGEAILFRWADIWSKLMSGSFQKKKLVQILASIGSTVGLWALEIKVHCSPYLFAWCQKDNDFFFIKELSNPSLCIMKMYPANYYNCLSQQSRKRITSQVYY